MTREEAIEFIAQSVKSDVDMAKVADAIKALKQEPRKGQWIKERNDYGEITHWHCSNCYDDSGFITTCKWDFCPQCGSDNREV